jgi:hypothetical protein
MAPPPWTGEGIPGSTLEKWLKTPRNQIRLALVNFLYISYGRHSRQSQ